MTLVLEVYRLYSKANCIEMWYFCGYIYHTHSHWHHLTNLTTFNQYTKQLFIHVLQRDGMHLQLSLQKKSVS